MYPRIYVYLCTVYHVYLLIYHKQSNGLSLWKNQSQVHYTLTKKNKPKQPRLILKISLFPFGGLRCMNQNVAILQGGPLLVINGVTLQEINISHPGEKENHLQNGLFRGYVSFLECISPILSRVTNPSYPIHFQPFIGITSLHLSLLGSGPHLVVMCCT